MIDAVSALGTGDVLIQGDEAQNATYKDVQHNGRGIVTNKDYTVVSVGKVYRSCSNCANNGGLHKVVIENLNTNKVTSGESPEFSSEAACLGAQGKLATLPAC